MKPLEKLTILANGCLRCWTSLCSRLFRDHSRRCWHHRAGLNLHRCCRFSASKSDPTLQADPTNDSTQMRATRAALKTVEMTDTERQMNGDLLRQLQKNRDLQEKIRYLRMYFLMMPRSRS